MAGEFRLGPRRLVASDLDMSHTCTQRAVKHSALGTFGSFRLVDVRDGYRLRAGGLCMRQSRDDTQLEVCLISSSNPEKPSTWKPPGGGVEDGELPATAAAREVLEEAGLQGTIEQNLGVYQNDEKKTRTQWFVMRVTKELETWEEGELGRRRKWFTLDAAIAMVETEYYRMLLTTAAKVLAQDSPCAATKLRGKDTSECGSGGGSAVAVVAGSRTTTAAAAPATAGMATNNNDTGVEAVMRRLSRVGVKREEPEPGDSTASSQERDVSAADVGVCDDCMAVTAAVVEPPAQEDAPGVEPPSPGPE